MTLKKSLARGAAIVFVTGSLLFTASCSDGDDSAANGYLVAEPDGKDYAYSYPESWEVIRSDSMYAIQAPEKNANISSSCYTLSEEWFASENYAEAEDPYLALLDNYVNAEEAGYIALLKDNFGENVEIISTDDCTVGGRAGKKLVYHLKVGEDDYHFATVLSILPTVGDAYLYDITYTAQNEQAYSAHSAVFDGVVASFEFK